MDKIPQHLLHQEEPTTNGIGLVQQVDTIKLEGLTSTRLEFYWFRVHLQLFPGLEQVALWHRVEVQPLAQPLFHLHTLIHIMLLWILLEIGFRLIQEQVISTIME